MGTRQMTLAPARADNRAIGATATATMTIITVAVGTTAETVAGHRSRRVIARSASALIPTTKKTADAPARAANRTTKAMATATMTTTTVAVGTMAVTAVVLR